MLEFVASYHSSYYCMQFEGNLMIQTHFGLNLSALGPMFSVKIKIRLCQSLDITVSYHHVQYQKKSNDPILRKLVMDGQTDQSDFIGCCSTNIERPA